MKYHDGGIGRSLRNQTWQVPSQVTTLDPGRVSVRERDGSSQSRQTRLVLGPYEVLQPRNICIFEDIQRIQIKARTPYNLGMARRERRSKSWRPLFEADIGPDRTESLSLPFVRFGYFIRTMQLKHQHLIDHVEQPLPQRWVVFRRRVFGFDEVF